MGVMSLRTFVRVIVCALLLVGLAVPSEAARRKSRKRKPDPVIVTPPTLVERAQTVRASLEKLARNPQASPVERADAALRIGLLSESDPDFAPMFASTNDSISAFIFERLIQTYRFDECSAKLAIMGIPKTDEHVWIDYQWQFVRDNLRGIDSLSREALKTDSSRIAPGLARAELAYRTLDYPAAESLYRKVLANAPSPVWRTRAAVGLARTLHRQDRYQESLDTLLTLMDSTTLSDDVLANMGLALISLTRINEAIEMFEEAARWNPWNELAHYYLGNGYSRQNYTQLREKNGACFPVETQPLNADARSVFANGDPETAKVICRSTMNAYDKDVESRTLMGSIYWTQGRYDSAASCFRDAITILPGYGRARSGLARSLECLRLRQNSHRASDSASFAKIPLPEVPRIGEFVVNWTSLSARHQKQVALSVAPWKAYLPVLIECGSRYYIKPLHETLSECPNMATIRDQRIDYDSRLWDDVRGCGGFTTVTGIEDVERSIFNGYTTVLHELTHQVHGVFPAEDEERIRNLFQVARLREDKGVPTFMSRYQQASVWEYFAEGANALFSPRRDAYDTREIVRERLMERDTALVAAIEHYLKAPNLTACYPVGLVNAAEDALEKQKTADALLFAGKAHARAPHSEVVLEELIRIHSILDRDSLALAYADSFIAVHPKRAKAYSGKASARYFTDGSVQAQLEVLTHALSVVDSMNQKEVRQSLGDALWYAGRYAEAAQQYRAVLSEVRDDPNALWGLGLALGDGGDFHGADSAFREAVSRRSGIVELRLDYARVLLQAGKLNEAAAQLEEAQLLARGDPNVIALKGWYTFKSGNHKEALRLLDRAVDMAPEFRLAQVLRLDVRRHYTPPKRRDAKKRDTIVKEAQQLRQMAQSDVPQWVFRERTASYVAAKTWPHFQTQLLTQIADGL